MKLSWKGQGLLAILAPFAALYFLSNISELIGRYAGIAIALGIALYGYMLNKKALKNGAAEAPHQVIGFRMEIISLAIAAVFLYISITRPI